MALRNTFGWRPATYQVPCGRLSILEERLQPSSNADDSSAYRIQSVDYPKTYLCNSHGYWSVNNQAITWVREPHLTRTTLWYIVDHDSWKAQKEPLYRPDSAVSLHGSSRHDPATARGHSDVQLELQRTEFRDDTLPGPQSPSSAPRKKLTEKKQPLDAKETVPVEKKEQLMDREKAVPELLEAKERGVADRQRLNDAREAKAAADMAGKPPQQSFLEGKREQSLGTKGEAATEVFSDQAQVVRGEGRQGELPSNAANPEKVQEQAVRDPTTLDGDEMSGFEPPQEGGPGAKPLENAALNMSKPERIVTEPESLKMKMPAKDGSDQKSGIPPPAQMDFQGVGIGARRLEDAQICAPDANPPSSLDPRRDGIGAPSPSLPRGLESPFKRAFGFFDLGGRDRERPALKPIVMPTGFSHLKRL